MSAAAFTVIFLGCAAIAEAQPGWTGAVATISTPVPTSGFIFRPIVAVEPNGNAYAIWNAVEGALVNTRIQASRFLAASGSWGAPMTLAGPGAFVRGDQERADVQRLRCA